MNINARFEQQQNVLRANHYMTAGRIGTRKRKLNNNEEMQEEREGKTKHFLTMSLEKYRNRKTYYSTMQKKISELKILMTDKTL